MGIYLLSEHTASGTPAVIEITGIDGSYNEYQFQLVNIHAQTDDTHLQFQVETDAADYVQPMTTTYHQTYNSESGGVPVFAYSTGNDQATVGDTNGVFQNIAKEMGNDNDASASGIFTLYNPASTVYVKHFMSTTNCYQSGSATMQAFVNGYINVAAAITKIKFMMSSGNIAAGTIYMYGVG